MKLVLGLVVTAGLLTGCAQVVPGSAVAGAAPVPVQAPQTSTKPRNPLEAPPVSGTPKSAQVLCTLLTFDDLPFKDEGANATQPTAQTNISEDFEQSCRWTVQLTKPDMKVGVQLYFRKQRDLSIKDPIGSYTVGAGRKLSYARADDTSCAMSMKFADGNVGIGVVDGSKLFGPECELGKKVAEKILTREPATLE